MDTGFSGKVVKCFHNTSTIYFSTTVLCIGGNFKRHITTFPLILQELYDTSRNMSINCLVAHLLYNCYSFMITILGNLPRTVYYYLLYWYIPTAFKQHFMWFFYCVCHILYCVPQLKRTPPCIRVLVTHCKDCVKFSPSSWLSHTYLKKSIKWSGEWDWWR